MTLQRTRRALGGLVALVVAASACSFERTPAPTGAARVQNAIGGAQAQDEQAGRTGRAMLDRNPALAASDQGPADAGSTTCGSPSSCEERKPCAPGAPPDSNCAPACGNGVLDRGEECDGDGLCNARCKVAFEAQLAHRYTFRGTGTRALDIIGNADGRVVGASLDGTGDLTLDGAGHVELPAGLLKPLKSASIEAWITWNGERIWERLFDFGNAVPGDEGAAQGTSFWSLTLRSEDETLQARVNFTEAPWDSEQDYRLDGPLLVRGTLQHLVVSFDERAGSMRLYVNGRRVDENNRVSGALAAIDDKHVLLGRSQYENDPLLNGTLHEFRVYREALPPEAIMRSFQRGPDPDIDAR